MLIEQKNFVQIMSHAGNKFSAAGGQAPTFARYDFPVPGGRTAECHSMASSCLAISTQHTLKMPGGALA